MSRDITRRSLLVAGAAGFGAGLASTKVGWLLRHLTSNEFAGTPAGPDAQRAPVLPCSGDITYAIKAFPLDFVIKHGESVPISFGALPGVGMQNISGYDIHDTLSGHLVCSDHTPRRLSEPVLSSYLDGYLWQDTLDVDSGGLTPGIYHGRLYDDQGRHSDPFHFVVRQRHQKSARPLVGIVYPTYTWQAYNSIGGGSFYVHSLPEPKQVSLRRPLWANDVPDSTPDEQTIHSPVAANQFAQLLHAESIDFVPLTSQDLHSWPAWLNQVRVLAFLVHDEYWSPEMRRNVHQFLTRGGRAALFAGNVCWMKIAAQPQGIRCRRWSPEPAGTREPTGLWHRSPISWPEEATFGQSFRFGGFPLASLFDAQTAAAAHHIDADSYAKSGGIKIESPAHPIFASTGLKRNENYGSEFPLLFLEIDGLPLNASGAVDRSRSSAIPREVEVLATGTVFLRDDRGENAHISRAAVVTETKIGAGRVLHLGSFGWFRALRAGDRRARTIVTNTLRYLLNHA